MLLPTLLGCLCLLIFSDLFAFCFRFIYTLLQTLAEVGIETEDEESAHSSQCGSPVSVRLPLISSPQCEGMEDRDRIMAKLDYFEEKASIKNQYLSELLYWFEDNLTLVVFFFPFLYQI